MAIVILLIGLPQNLPTASASSSTVVGIWSPAYGNSNITVTDGTLGPGSQFTVYINITNAPMFNAFEFALFYDPTTIAVVSYNIVGGTMFGSTAFVSSYSNTTSATLLPNTTNIGAFRIGVVNLGTAHFSGSGTLAHITFRVKGFGASPLALAPAAPDVSNAAISAIGGRPVSTRLVVSDQFSTHFVETPMTTSDGYFRNVAGKLGPIASFSSSPESPRVGQNVVFNASASFDPDNATSIGVGRYFWDFGDGQIADTNRTSVSNAFHFLGNYSVLLTVIDSDNNFEGMKTGIISIVTAPAPCAQSLLIVQVPRDCPSIQTAIDSVVPGGTIQVGPGSYSESPTIQKPLILLGSGNTTIVDGTIFLQPGSHNVRISGFRLRQTALGSGLQSPPAIELNHSDMDVISNNAITGGLLVFASSEASITNDNIENGIILSSSSNTFIVANRLANGFLGISIESSPLTHMSRNLIENNTVNFRVVGDTLLEYQQNIDTSNMINGLPIYYLQGTNGFQGPQAFGYLGIVNSTNGIVRDGSVSAVGEGILLAGSSNVTVTGFHATKVQQGIALFDSNDVRIIDSSLNICGLGVSLLQSNANSIINNTISCVNGIEMRDSNQNNIDKNKISESLPNIGAESPSTGIFALKSHQNKLSRNQIVGYEQGLFLGDSAANLFEANTVQGDVGSRFQNIPIGVLIVNSPRNIFRGNQVSNAFASIMVVSTNILCIIGPEPCHRVADYIQDIDPSNRVDDRPVYYIVNQHGLTVPENAGFVAVVNSTDITINNLTLSFTGDGIQVISSANISVERTNITYSVTGVRAWLSTGLNVRNSQISQVIYSKSGIFLEDSRRVLLSGNLIRPVSGSIGIWLENSTDVRIEGNSISSYGFGGILLLDSSGNFICRNTLNGFPFSGSKGIPYGIALRMSTGNTIVGNTIANNGYGLFSYYGIGNTVYRNNFLNNAVQAIGNQNTYDNGVGQGNFWSDYNGEDTDGDGVGDTMLPHLGIDNHPLMSPWAPQGLSAKFSGRGAWPQNPLVSREKNNGLQTFFAKAANTGTSSEWVEAIFNVTSSEGTRFSLVSGPFWLSPGEKLVLQVRFAPPLGVYSVTVQLKFSSDAYLTWKVAGTKSFSFKVIGS